MSCAKCERPFRHGTEDTITINRKTYHSDCLSCDKCSKPYDGSFTPDALDQEALCLECTQAEKTKSAKANQTKPVETKAAVTHCGGCGLPFNPDSRHITKRYNNKEYHHNCLKCQSCQTSIEGEIYEDDKENKIYCTSCFKQRDQKSFQKQKQEKQQNQQKSVHFAEKLAETLNRDELAAYYRGELDRDDDLPPMAGRTHTGKINYCAACMLPFHAGSCITEACGKEYHYECFRCERCSQPIDGNFSISPDGSKFKCGSCPQQNYNSSTKFCTGCGSAIEPNVHRRIDFKDRSFHAECFTCAICRRRMDPSQTFLLRNDQPWCQQCEIDTKYCTVCAKPILLSGITYEGQEYHVACFKCSNCHKLLENEKLLCAHNGEPLCVECNDELFAKRCYECKKIIPSSERGTIVADKPYHEKCFVCVKCRRPIGTKTFYKGPSGFLCVNCA
ncbi:unnamed protein product [Adineta ricciae]|uniref:LIM zinc-binding domain-containing protein n=1 Tax=Adineta ricciae TaxID=249248 RepID=A0A815CSD1_ADIRI|nr:unnamed protein product [Adineta ricciae]CAF1287924.1 unnamed protein product [Adineta ricciae]